MPAAEPIPIQKPPSIEIQSSNNSPPVPFAGSAVGLSTSSPGNLFGKWSFSPLKSNQGPSMAHSPPGQSSAQGIPSHPTTDEHDSLEFGELSDLKTTGWAAAAAARGQRRAVSMSMSPGTNLVNGPTSPPYNGVVSDKMARGNGVLRRLSLSSTGFKQQAPPVPNPPNPTPIGSLQPQPPTLAAHPPPPPDHRAGGGRRRFSESAGRKRGVSPMGERLLRDQVHF